MSEPEIKSAFKRRLEFAKSAILDPLQVERRIGLGISANFARVEAARWLLLGVQIGYLDAREAYELVSSEKEAIITAWQSLRDANLSSTDSGWPQIILSDAAGEPHIDGKSFVAIYEESPSELALNAFQNLLLLTSENILLDHALFFLDVIGWTNDDIWVASSSGELDGYGAQELASGFASILAYLQGFSAWSRDTDRLQRYMQIPVHEVSSELALELDSRGKLNERDLLRYLVVSAIGNASPRFRLTLPSVRDRYYIFTGHFVNLTRDGSPAWFGAQRTAFEELTRLLLSFGDESSERDRHWYLFRTGWDQSVQSDSTRFPEPRPFERDAG
jgi:hypothetical protein